MKKYQSGQKYKKWWYFIVQTMIRRYKVIKTSDALQSRIFCDAIEKAVKETVKYDNWAERYKAISMLYFDGMTVGQVADRIYYSRRTVQRWSNDFVNDVGKYAGFD